MSETRTRPAGGSDHGDIERIDLQVEPGGFRAGQLKCFAGSGRRLDSAVDGDGPYRVTIDVVGVGSPGRNKVNCTAPAVDGSGDFYWVSRQWLVDGGDGQY